MRESLVERLLENALVPLTPLIRRELSERDGKPPSEDEVEKELNTRIPSYVCFWACYCVNCLGFTYVPEIIENIEI